MKKPAFAFVALTVLALLGGFWARMMVVKVRLDQVGVRTQNFSLFGEKGVVKNDYDKPGWYRAIPIIDSWSFFDKTIQTMHMGHGWGGTVQKLELTSADGYKVSLDITVKYRIKPGEAHLLFQSLGPGNTYKQKVENETQDTCRRVFGQINTEGFYDPEIREQRTNQALEKLRKVLKPRHVEVVDLLVRDVAFDPGYEKKIKQKKLADQGVELNKSKANAALYRGVTNKIRAETEAMVKVINQQKELEIAKLKAENDRQIEKIRADYRQYVTEKKADADLYAAQKKANAQLSLFKAEAEGEKLRNEAMAGPGGKIKVALEAARNLQLRSVVFSTQRFDPLDLDSVASKLGVKQ